MLFVVSFFIIHETMTSRINLTLDILSHFIFSTFILNEKKNLETHFTCDHTKHFKHSRSLRLAAEVTAHKTHCSFASYEK
jgi:hypothetical protein